MSSHLFISRYASVAIADKSELFQSVVSETSISVGDFSLLRQYANDQGHTGQSNLNSCRRES